MTAARQGSGIHVDCSGRVLVDGQLAGYVTAHRGGTNRWQWILEGGERSPVFYPTRRVAVAWLLRHPRRSGPVDLKAAVPARPAQGSERAGER